ncbi:hypothetical protein UPYG_G00059690 [Umbra pygmaea]|uniref:C2H2-type domain-containing protein n=1 Tax=Umbra pygmaea TaxID=75934 RepID=A0ABD0XWG9_UMBPY
MVSFVGPQHGGKKLNRRTMSFDWVEQDLTSMKPGAGVCDAGPFTERYCNICNAQLISKSQRVAHYESKKHANKVRLFYMLHPEDGGPPSKRLRRDNADSEETAVDDNKCCSLCNMVFTSAIVAQSHYQGKTHAKRLQLVQGPPSDTSTTATAPTDSAPCPHATPTLLIPPPPSPQIFSLAVSDDVACRWCFLCGAWFNKPSMAQQHYVGKKHSRNAAKARLLEQLADNLDCNQNTGVKNNYGCRVCDIKLNSIQQFYAHLQGSKHLSNLNQQQSVGL